jgi:hypothetical protein
MRPKSVRRFMPESALRVQYCSPVRPALKHHPMPYGSTMLDAPFDPSFIAPTGDMSGKTMGVQSVESLLNL